MDSDKIIDTVTLNAQWDEMMKGVFQSFIESTVGLDEAARPACYGSGAKFEYCIYCWLKLSC